jgi:hypothetical protein
MININIICKSRCKKKLTKATTHNSQLKHHQLNTKNQNTNLRLA